MKAQRRVRRRRLAGTLLACLVLMVAAPPAQAHPHDPQRSGHPLRIVAYALHPVGVILDTLLFRPAHWIVSHEPLQTLFGHEG